MSLLKAHPPTTRKNAKFHRVPLVTKEKAIELLAQGYSDQSVADTIGVRKMTVYNWRQQPDFQAQLDRVRRDTTQRVRQRMEEVSGEALDHLLAIVRSPKSGAMPRVQAIAQIFDRIGLTGSESHERHMEQRTMEVLIAVMERAREFLPTKLFSELHERVMRVPHEVEQVSTLKVSIAMEKRLESYKKITPQALSPEELEALSVHYSQLAKQKLKEQPIDAEHEEVKT